MLFTEKNNFQDWADCEYSSYILSKFFVMLRLYADNQDLKHSAQPAECLTLTTQTAWTDLDEIVCFSIVGPRLKNSLSLYLVCVGLQSSNRTHSFLDVSSCQPNNFSYGGFRFIRPASDQFPLNELYKCAITTAAITEVERATSRSSQTVTMIM